MSENWVTQDFYSGAVRAKALKALEKAKIIEALKLKHGAWIQTGPKEMKLVYDKKAYAKELAKWKKQQSKL